MILWKKETNLSITPRTCCEVRSRNHKLVYQCESILRRSIARLAHFNACAMNQARTQTFENGVWGCEYQVFDHDGGVGRANLKKIAIL